MATVKENILHSLNKNGFPEKRVSLPFQAIFKASKQAGTNLSDVLSELEQQEILNSVEGDRILFFTKDTAKASEDPKQWEGIDFSNDMVKEAMEKISKMDPDELEKMKQQVAGMSETEKSKMMEQAKEMFNKPKK